MLNKNNLAKYSSTLVVIATMAAVLSISSSVKAATDPVCPDTIIHCWCSNGNQICNHQLTNCSVPTEIHNEMPGAAACATVSSSPIASATSSASLVIGVGGGPIVSSTPAVVASESNNQAGELPKTGLPLGALALVGLAPLGYKLKSFTSRFGGHSDPNLIWTGKQLKK